MLVLTRKQDEKIVINNNIIIHVLRVGADNVSIGIEAPRDIPIHRKEIQDRVNVEKRSVDQDNIRRFSSLAERRREVP